MAEGGGGLQLFLTAFAFTGVVTGTVLGALATWRGWHALKAFVAALALCVAAMVAASLSGGFDFQATVGALLLAPLVAFFPTGAGFVTGRSAMLRWLRR